VKDPNSEVMDQSGPYYSLTVREVIQEIADARSYVLEIPDSLLETFAYQAGQFLTFRVTVDGERLVRCYSFSSSSVTDSAPKFTVKRVTEGRVSNHINDAIEEGTRLEVMKPAGIFCLQDRDRQLLLFAGGSGITPVISLLKTALATTRRSIRLLYANRNGDSIIFRAELDELQTRYPERLEVVHRLDDVHGLADIATIRAHVGDARDADFYICGPGPYMEVVEQSLALLGVADEQIFIERFTSPELAREETAAPREQTGQGATVSVSLDGNTRELQLAEGETILKGAVREGMAPPFACEEGYCGCCMAMLEEGEVKLKANKALDAAELAKGWILTCQALPTSSHCRVKYPD
jgi:3-ketosteroid 9alpha-monooxygenase subunit B